jgi:hypothetical protein
MSLLNDEQGFRDQQRTAASIRGGAQPQEQQAMDWSWLEGGLPEVEVMDSGYAKPLAGLDTDKGGYQRGGAAFRYNPSTGSWDSGNGVNVNIGSMF